MSTPRPIDWDRVRSAFDFALAEHCDQARKSTDIPYMAHLLGVTAYVLEFGGHTDETVAALLHDTVEDQGGPETLSRVEGEFGPETARFVLALSDSYKGRGQEKDPWLERKTAYLEHLPDNPVPVLLVSAADKLHNLRATLADLRAEGPSFWERFTESDPHRQLWYYTSLADIYTARASEDAGLAGLARELQVAVAELKRLIGAASA
jgi:(p)ppGpp synthase/HD superfamily hydrolase